MYGWRRRARLSINNGRQIVSNKQVDLPQRVLHAIQLRDANERVEIVQCNSVDKVVLTILDDQEALQMIGGRHRLEHLHMRGEACA